MLCNISALHVYRFIDQLQSKQTHELLSSLLQEKKLKKFISVTMVMDTPPSYLFIAPMGACTQLTQNVQSIVNPSVHLHFEFSCETQTCCISSFISRNRCLILEILCWPFVGRSFHCKSQWPTFTHLGVVSRKQFAAWSARSRMKSIP